MAACHPFYGAVQILSCWMYYGIDWGEVVIAVAVPMFIGWMVWRASRREGRSK